MRRWVRTAGEPTSRPWSERVGMDANFLGTIENPGGPSGRLESFPVQGVCGPRLAPQPAPQASFRGAGPMARGLRCLP